MVIGIYDFEQLKNSLSDFGAEKSCSLTIKANFLCSYLFHKPAASEVDDVENRNDECRY